mmetsp:Transcript_4749/g.17952  ORF Transcript_4749/g.17952 Transcript_4749/m.17952 type:complete len:241 (+) Transcript_4749:757-1479(+)
MQCLVGASQQVRQRGLAQVECTLRDALVDALGDALKHALHLRRVLPQGGLARRQASLHLPGQVVEPGLDMLRELPQLALKAEDLRRRRLMLTHLARRFGLDARRQPRLVLALARPGAAAAAAEAVPGGALGLQLLLQQRDLRGELRGELLKGAHLCLHGGEALLEVRERQGDVDLASHWGRAGLCVPVRAHALSNIRIPAPVERRHGDHTRARAERPRAQRRARARARLRGTKRVAECGL